MKRIRWILDAIAVLIVLALTQGCGIHSDDVARMNEAMARAKEQMASFQEIKIITREQVDKLAQLGDNATKEDVVAILGPANMDTSTMGMGDQRSAMIQSLGEDYVYQYLDTVPAEYSWGHPGSGTLHYNTGQQIPGQAISGLDVFLRNNRFGGYVWSGNDQSLQEADLVKVKPLMKVVSRGKLYECLGRPNRMGSLKQCVYAFKVPADIAVLGVDSLEARWEGNSQDELKFVSIQPGFDWKYYEIDYNKWLSADHKSNKMSSADLKSMMKSLEQFEERSRKKPSTTSGSSQVSRAGMVTEYQALLERELRTHGHVDSGPWVERAEGVLKKLQPLLPKEFGPIHLTVLQSSAFNASAMRRGRDISLILYTGLLEHLADDHQLAFVVAHELSHISLGHLYVPINYMIQYFHGIEMLDPMVSNFYRMSQIQEHGADLMAAQLLGRAGFNPSAGVSILAKTQELNPPPAELRFSTHPEHEARRILLNWYLDFLGLKKDRGTS